MNTLANASLLGALLGALLVTAGCATPESVLTPGAVRTFGSLREALRDGATNTRVDVATITNPNLVAIGAPTGLDGEITIIDGACHVSRVREGKVQTEHPDDVAATILFAADVPEWQSVAVTSDIAASELAAFVVKSAQDAGIDTRSAFPFVIEGELSAMKVHVLAGECPIRAEMLGETMKTPPAQWRIDKIRGRLVGMYASAGGGVITHHGSVTHVHAVLDGEAGLTAHCEAVRVAAGAVLRLPRDWAAR